MGTLDFHYNPANHCLSSPVTPTKLRLLPDFHSVWNSTPEEPRKLRKSRNVLSKDYFAKVNYTVLFNLSTNTHQIIEKLAKENDNGIVSHNTSSC